MSSSSYHVYMMRKGLGGNWSCLAQGRLDHHQGHDHHHQGQGDDVYDDVKG